MVDPRGTSREACHGFRIELDKKPVWLELPVQRLWCATCGHTCQDHRSFAHDKRTYTHGFER